MHGHGEAKPKLGRWLIVANVLAAALAIGTSAVGWSRLGYCSTDVLFHSVKVLEMDEVYNRLWAEREAEPDERCAAGRPGSPIRADQVDEGRILLDWGRLFGVVFFSFATGCAILLIFPQFWLRRKIRWLYKGHCIIIGNSELAHRLGPAVSRNTVHFSDRNGEVRREGRMVRMTMAASAAARDLIEQGRGERSNAIVVALDDDMAGIDMAIALQQAVGQAAKPPRLVLRLRDYWLAQRFHSLPGADRIETMSDAALVARDALRRFPPYLLAADHGAERMHLLLLGEPDWLEAMMTEALLTTATLRFGKPSISFACADPVTFAARLRERYPEIDREADLAFLGLADERPWELAGFMLEALPPGPLTAVYCLFPEAGCAIGAYLAFDQAARAQGGVVAPVFVLTDGQGFADPDPGSALSPLQFVPIGGQKHMVHACSLDTDRSTLAETFHQTYRSFAPSNGEAGKPWRELKEEFRISNRRAVAHIPAKLFEAGFDLRGWMGKNDIWTQLPALAEGEHLFETPAQREALAVLEHDRWMADRRLSGWRYDPDRDDARRLHPYLVAFAALSEDIQGYDRQFIDLLARILVAEKGTLSRLSSPQP